MHTVQVLDKTFGLSISADAIRERVEAVAAKVSADMAGKNPLFVAVLNGSFIFAADLLRAVTIPCEINFLRYASYEGMQSTGEVRQLLGLTQDITGRHVVIVEDIIDSGLTMQHLVAELEKHHPESISICALLVKPGNMKMKLDIPYCCFRIPNDFIVGYGLDYDGYGRNLPAIYTVQ